MINYKYNCAHTRNSVVRRTASEHVHSMRKLGQLEEMVSKHANKVYDNDNDNENILFDHFFVTKKDIIQNKCHIYTSYRLVWRLLLRQITLSLS